MTNNGVQTRIYSQMHYLQSRDNELLDTETNVTHKSAQHFLLNLDTQSSIRSQPTYFIVSRKLFTK
jgi:hypothetical protein